MLDFLLQRYGGNVDYVLNMDYREFFDLYVKALEKQTENRLFQMYCSLLPNFTSETYMTFEDFKNQNAKTVISDGGKTDEENIEFANTIIRMELVERK